MKKGTRGAIAGICFLMGMCFVAFEAEAASEKMLEAAYVKRSGKKSENRNGTKWFRIGPNSSQREANQYFEAFLRQMKAVDTKVDELKYYENEQRQLHEEWERLQRKYPDKFFNFIIK